ncbi:FliH/SctL family protein [Polycyclovorans algicola]|uniref:FliH/SctL family protein n=1 Tax=Polycyclovorans algicola TaxID=616992 RepID=UPI0004A6C416|nr:FliH/SctL family protein [Polycyclovorans algicola]
MNDHATPFEAESPEQIHHWQAPQLDRPDPRAARKSPPTAAHLEALEQAAWDEGYQRGRKEGEAAARKSAEPKIDHLRLLIAALDEPLAADRAQLTDTLCQLTVALARTLTEQALMLDPAALKPLADKALAALGESRGPVTLRVAPAAAEALKQLVETPSDWRIEADPTLGAADVCVDGDPLSIDARLSTRLAQWAADWQARA